MNAHLESAILNLEFLALPFPSRETLSGLRGKGILQEALADERCFVKAAMVMPTPPDRFDFSAEGVEAVIVACRDAWEEVTDLVAFQIERPARVRRFEGRAVFLGEHVVSNPATYVAGQPLRVFRDPIGWLKAGGYGAVILDRSVIWRRLLDVPAIAGEDEEHAKELAALRTPPHLCRVLVPEAA